MLTCAFGLPCCTGAPTDTWLLRCCRRARPTTAVRTGSPWAACSSNCSGGESCPPFHPGLFTHRVQLPVSKGVTCSQSPLAMLTRGISMVCFSFSRHSPFRQHKTKDKHEIDRMTLTVVRHLFRVTSCSSPPTLLAPHNSLWEGDTSIPFIHPLSTAPFSPHLSLQPKHAVRLDPRWTMGRWPTAYLVSSVVLINGF